MVRASLLAALTCLLAACRPGDDLGPFADSRIPPAMAERFFPPEGWTWGYIGVGESPLQRYGVASTQRVPTAIVIIVPGYGETAETWFETASNLIARGCTVWILDRAGQGGSARETAPRDLGSIADFNTEISTLRELVRVVVRPPSGARLFLLSHADGAVVALAAVRAGLPVAGVIASSAALGPAGELKPPGRFSRPEAKPRGWTHWSRETPDDMAAGRTHDRFRGAVTKAWMTANPDLRLAGPSRAWDFTYRAASRALAQQSGASVPVTMLNPNSTAAALCARMERCRIVTLGGARAALHLEADAWRAPWLNRLEQVIGMAAPTVDPPVSEVISTP